VSDRTKRAELLDAVESLGRGIEAHDAERAYLADQLRSMALKAVDAGASVSEVARLCRVSRPTIYEWLRVRRHGIEDRVRDRRSDGAE